MSFFSDHIHIQYTIDAGFFLVAWSIGFIYMYIYCWFITTSSCTCSCVGVRELAIYMYMYLSTKHACSCYMYVISQMCTAAKKYNFGSNCKCCMLCMSLSLYLLLISPYLHVDDAGVENNAHVEEAVPEKLADEEQKERWYLRILYRLFPQLRKGMGSHTCTCTCNMSPPTDVHVDTVV